MTRDHSSDRHAPHRRPRPAARHGLALAAAALAACDRVGPDLVTASPAPSAVLGSGTPTPPIDPCSVCAPPSGRILFTHVPLDGTPAIDSVLPDGMGLEKEGDDLHDPAWLGPSHPSWSRDGRWLVFEGARPAGRRPTPPGDR